MPRKLLDKQSQILYDVHNFRCNVYSREIFLHPYEELDGETIDFRCATSLEKNIRILDNENNTNILIHLNSIGGDCNDAFSIYDSILNSKSPITILAYGCIASAATIILQAATTRVLMPNCDMMIHYGDDENVNTHLGMVSYTEYSKKLCNKILDIYAKKCISGKFFSKMSIKRCKTYLDRKIKEKGDWWLSADEALNYGFTDGIYNQQGFTLDEIRK